jgi:hypothetical protein
LTTALFNKDILLAKILFIVAFCACPSSGLCRGVGPLDEKPDYHHCSKSGFFVHFQFDY